MEAPTRCDTHPGERAGWTCGGCGRRLCLACGSSRQMGGGFVVICRHCGGFGNPIYVRRARATFLQMLPSALIYPFSRNGLITLAACGVVFGILFLAPGFGTMIGAATWVSYLFVVIRSSADGHQDVPEAEDFSNIFDLFAALFKAALAMLLSVMPFLLYAFEIRPTVGLQVSLLYDPLTYITSAAGLAWTPMAIMLAAVGSPFISIVHPALALHCIRQIGRDFAFAVVFFWGCVVAWLLLSWTGLQFVRISPPIPLLPRMFAQAVSLYPGLVGARALGLLLFARGAEIGFGRPVDHVEPVLGDAMPPEEVLTPSSSLTPVAPIELTSDLATALTVTAPHEAKLPPPSLVSEDAATDEEIRLWADLKQFEAVAVAYRERRGAISVLTAPELVQVARIALERNDFQTASHAYKRVGYDHPESPHAPEALLISARLLIDHLNRRDEGDRLLNHLLRAYPESSEAAEAAGQLLTEDSQITEEAG